MVSKNQEDDKATQGGISNSEETGTKKLKYPRSIPFIICNEFCERFNYYGMRTILSLYLQQEFGYNESFSTVVFHIFTMLVYLMAIFGAIIADSWLGKFRTILYLSIVYTIGSGLVSIGAIPALSGSAIVMTFCGLALIAIGSGGIKPCVSAFGGDQFKLPEQVKQMATFFSLFYFAINSGSLISTTVTPILRADVHCMGKNSCYSLAFGVPAVLMAISIIVFILGRFLYVSKPPSGNMFVSVNKAIFHAIIKRWKDQSVVKKTHWLDYSETKYGKQLINNIKVLLRILVLYIPLPVFWALFDQQGSRWTFQANHMDGQLGSVEIKPDQMQMINPLLILLFIPLYNYILYPMLSKIGISRPLQKLTMGGILAGIAFVVSGIVELNLEKTYSIAPSIGFSQLRVFNGFSECDFEFKTDIPGHEQFILKALESFQDRFIDVSTKSIYNYNITSISNGCEFQTNNEFQLEDGKAVSFFLNNNEKILTIMKYIDDPKKTDNGDPLIRILPNFQMPKTITFKDIFKGKQVLNKNSNSEYNLNKIPPSTYDIFVNEKMIKQVEITRGGVHTYIISEYPKNEFKMNIIEISPPNSMKIYWMIPQYVIMTLGEVMFSVTGLEFSYSQAPESMKSVLQACWLLTIAIGNLIVVIIAKVKLFDSQTYEFFLFAGLMFVDMIIFMFLAIKYKSNDSTIDKTVELDTVPN